MAVQGVSCYKHWLQKITPYKLTPLYPRFSFAKSLSLPNVEVWWRCGGRLCPGGPAWEPQGALPRSRHTFLFSCHCRCSLPLFGLVAAVRFTSWHWAGLPFWAGRRRWWGSPAPRALEVLRTRNSLQLELGTAAGPPRTAVRTDPRVGFFPPLLPAPLSPVYPHSFLFLTHK